MTNISRDQIQHLPEYQRLIHARRRLTWLLSVMVILVYFALILSIAFAPEFLGTPIGSGVTSIGMVLGMGMILFCFLVTGFYVYYANHVLEPLTATIANKVGHQL